MNPLVSVIVTTYNQEKTIGRTLDAILSQECHFAFEIVIGEDGSTDTTRLICEQYALRHPDVVRLMPQAPNKGIVDNYFDCLLATCGKYIADCAGDDYWIDLCKLEKEVEMMEADEDITLVHTGWNWYYIHTQEVKKNTYTPYAASITDGRQMAEAILTQTQSPVIHLCTALYRASVIKQIYAAHTEWFRGRELGCEDLQIAFTLAMSGKIGYLPESTLNYSIGNVSVSNPHFGTDGERKQFVFTRRTTDLSFLLYQAYQMPYTPRINSFFEVKTFALLMHAFRCNDHKLYQEALACQKKWQVSNTKRIRVLHLLMNTPWLWNIALVVRNLAVFLKNKRR